MHGRTAILKPLAFLFGVGTIDYLFLEFSGRRQPAPNDLCAPEWRTPFGVLTVLSEKDGVVVADGMQLSAHRNPARIGLRNPVLVETQLR